MAKIKYDGVIEAVRYKSEGLLSLVRAFERRGAAFSDCILLSREELIKRLESGKRYMLGKRLQNFGGVFEVTARINLVSAGDIAWITTHETSDHDDLEGAALF